MNIDNLHDALNLLDDDLIEEVEVLRSERKMQVQRRSKKWIVRYASLAACVLLCVVCVYAVGGFFLNVLTGGKKSDSSAIGGEDIVIKGESATVESEQDAVPPQDSGTESENTTTATGEAKSEAREIKVEVTALVREGIVGVVKESDDTEMYDVGTELTVVLLEDKSLVESGAVGMQYQEYVADDVAFPVGSVVIVRFMPQENTKPNNGTDTENTEYILYADEITFEDNE